MGREANPLRWGEAGKGGGGRPLGRKGRVEITRQQVPVSMSGATFLPRCKGTRGAGEAGALGRRNQQEADGGEGSPASPAGRKRSG